MDRQRNIDRDRKYHAIIRELWDKYKHDDQELEHQLLRNEIEHNREMLEEENYPDIPEDDDDQYYQKKKKKRLMYAPMVGYPSALTANYYGQVKKRDYPILPWLPASRKKRFPVAKRSPRPEELKRIANDDKVVKDLKAIFGENMDDDDKKMKRSSDDQINEDKKKRMAVKKSELEEDKKKKGMKKPVLEEDDKKKRTVKKSDFMQEKEKKMMHEPHEEDKKRKRSVKRKRSSNDDCDEKDEDCDEDEEG